MTARAVMAIGEAGLQLTPASKAVGVPVALTGPGNTATPDSIRYLRIFGAPKRLTRASRHENGRVDVRWVDEKGEAGWCVVITERDALDPLFDSLPAKSRARILDALA
jgi:hypothetical protein